MGFDFDVGIWVIEGLIDVFLVRVSVYRTGIDD